jgi:tryptophan synthase alpha chain
MKNNIDTTIEKIKKEKRIGIMTHLITGYPTIPLSKKIAETLARGRADILEIQIPFSDPMADGPLIVEACQRSLENGATVKNSFELAKFVNNKLKTPVVLMTYANIIIHMGIENFCAHCKEYGVSGIIAPDLPYDSEEGKKLKKYAEKNGVHLIYLISPAVEGARLKEIKNLAVLFIVRPNKGLPAQGRILQKISIHTWYG